MVYIFSCSKATYFMKESETQEAIEAGDQRKSVYKARFCDKYKKANDGDNKYMKSLISALPHHSLYPCKAVPSNIFSDITWTKLAGNIPLTPRKTPAHQSLSTWRYVFKHFFQCLIWGSQVCKCLLLWHFLILWEFHSLIHHPIWFDQKKTRTIYPK